MLHANGHAFVLPNLASHTYPFCDAVTRTSPQNLRLRCITIGALLFYCYVASRSLYEYEYKLVQYNQYNKCSSVLQDGVEEDLENNNEDGPEDVIGAEGEEKEQEKKERQRKTSKYMTKYERARILGTRALQIRYVCQYQVSE